MKLNKSFLIGTLAAMSFVACSSTPQKNETSVPPTPPAAPAFGHFGSRDYQSNRFPANSMRDECALSPSGVNFGESEFLYTTPSSKPEDQGAAMLVSENGGDLGTMAEYCGNFEKGKSYNFSNAASHVTVTIKIIGDDKQVGYWNSNTDMPEPDKHCAPSADTVSSTSEIQIDYKKDNKVLHSAKSILYHNTYGGYHGYWGQPGCPSEPK